MRLRVLNVKFKQFNVWRETFRTSHLREMGHEYLFRNQKTFLTAEAEWTKAASMFIKKLLHFFPFVLRA